MKTLLFLFYYLTVSISYAQWSNIGPSSADIRFITGNSNYLFASTLQTRNMCNVFYSSDQGNTWISTGFKDYNNTPYINAISANDSFLFVAVNNGLFRTSNLGESWQDISNPSTNACISVACENSNVIAQVIGALIFSSNNGNTWTNVSYSSQNVNFSIIKNNIIYTSGTGSSYGSDIRKSTNFGQSWINMNFDLLSTSGTSAKLYADNLYLYVNSIGTFPRGGIFRTTLLGNPNWQQINNGINFNNEFYHLFGSSIYGNNNIIFAGFGSFSSTPIGAPYINGIYYSTNNGNNWIFSNTLNFTRTLYVQNGLVYAGSSTGILRSNLSPVNFQEIGSGLSGIDVFTGLAIDPATIFVGTDKSGIYYSSNNGINWTSKNNGLNSLKITGIKNIGNKIFASVYLSGVYVSDDLGETWTNIGLNSEYPISLGVNGNKLFVGTRNKLYTTTNSGINWTSVYTTSSNNDFFTFAFKNADIGYAVTYVNGTGLPKLLKTADGGSSWFQLSNTPFGFNTSIVTSGDNLIVGKGSGPNAGYYSSDGGLSWQPLSIEGKYANFTVSGNDIYMSTDSSSFGNGKIYKSTDNGISWINIGKFYNSDFLRWIFSDSLNLYVPAEDNGLYRRALPVKVNTISNSLPEKYLLLQNYPNPFNPITIIEFSLPEHNNVKIEVFDLLGKKISEIINENLSAGSYKISFDGSNYSNGIYFYKITAGDFIQTKKMILLK